MMLPLAAHAGCTNPTGNERAMIYNGDYHTYQFCNGTSWIIAGQILPSDSFTKTFGYTAIAPTDDSGNRNLLLAQPASLSHAGTITSLSFYVTTAAGNLRLGIYDNAGAGGIPKNKLAETNGFTPTTGWNTVDLITPVALTAGTYYLVYLPSSNSLHFRVDADPAGPTAYVSSFTYGTMPATYPATPPSTPAQWSFYATLTSGCFNPTGNERAIIYNRDYHTAQFCNGVSWIPLGQGSGGGGAGCSNPTAAEGRIIYNGDYHTYQYCNGADWVAFGGGSSVNPGYFVLSSSTWNGNLGGMAGANSKCLTELTTNTGWKGYATANANGQLTTTKVHAAICDVSDFQGYPNYGDCNELKPLSTYYFAYAGDSSKGGASFTTDSSGLGPNDSADWSDAGHFGVATSRWNDQYSAGDTAWSYDHWTSGQDCNAWTSASSARSGDAPVTNDTTKGRWISYGGHDDSCNHTQHLICYVDP
jgi:hypothetical protein